MGSPTFATSARHPATGVTVLVLGVTAASWALAHASESAARAAWEIPRLTAPDGSTLVLAPMPPVLASDSLQMSLGWTLTVLAWVAVCWVASARHARGGRSWLPVGAGAVALGLQCALAFLPPNGLVGAVSWPGPAQPIDWSVDSWALTLADPAALAPAVVLLALVGARWWALRPSRDSPFGAGAADVAGRAAVRRALLAVGIPALALWLGAVAVIVATDTFKGGTGGAALLPTTVLEPGGSLLLLVVAAALVSGAGRRGALALVAVLVATTAPIVSMWSGGGADLLLLACTLSAGATACAASWRPVARALADLRPDAPQITAAPSRTT